MSVGVYLGVDEMGAPAIIKSYVIDGNDIDYPQIRLKVPAFVTDSTLKARLNRGVRRWDELKRHPKDALQSNGKRNGTKHNQSWKAQKQAQIERTAQVKQQKENHGW